MSDDIIKMDDIKGIKISSPEQIEELEAQIIEAEQITRDCTDRLTDLNNSLKSYMKAKEMNAYITGVVKRKMKSIYTNM